MNKFFNAAKQGDTLTMAFYDTIGESMFGEGATPAMVAEALKGDFKNVELHLNSPGGDAFAGVAIYNLLKASSKPVNVIVDGLAASAASIIAMAGDTITMNQGSVMMIHEAMSMAFGNASDMQKMADTLTSVTSGIADIYVSKTGLPKDTVLKMQNEETWMTADEAVQKGFATSVNKDKNAVKNSFDLTAFRNAPPTLKAEAKTKEVDGEHLTAGDFVYVGDPDKTDTWSLPWHFSTEEKTQSHLRDALARFDQDEVIPESHKAEAYAKLVRLAKEHGIDVSKKNEASEAILSDAADALRLSVYVHQLETNKRK
jgi:ATP-dependent Clp protease protease subunit